MYNIMSVVRILSDHVANQIAAGEVIERPVSVIKELIENSIDADAKRIYIKIRNGGKSLIQVIDNGIGMREDDAILSIERHATSKLRESNDLNKITSMGFRGEALPSIASISKFTLKTRKKECQNGTEIQIYAGKIINKKECGIPYGTQISVENLFATVPARKKYLKADSYESSLINKLIRLIALAHPDISFELIDNEKTIINTAKCINEKFRITELWNNSFSKNLIYIQNTNEESSFKIHGYISKPGIDRSSKNEMLFFVNKRPIFSKLLIDPVKDSYRGLLPRGRFPIAFVFIEINPSEIDINVHPTKKEIKFENEREVSNSIFKTIENALYEKKESEIYPSNNNIAKAHHLFNYKTLQKESSETIQANDFSNIDEKSQNQTEDPVTINRQSLSYDTIKETDWKFIDTLNGNYALYKTQKGIVILNILRAKQRIRYDEIIKQFNNSKICEQTLMIPIQLQFDPILSNTIDKNIKLLIKLGFTLEKFGENFYRLISIPSYFDGYSLESLIRDIIEEIHTRSAYLKKQPFEFFLKFVAKKAIKEFYFKDNKETNFVLEILPKNLLNSLEPLTCPNGKKIFFEIDKREIEKKFN